MVNVTKGIKAAKSEARTREKVMSDFPLFCGRHVNIRPPVRDR